MLSGVIVVPVHLDSDIRESNLSWRDIEAVQIHLHCVQRLTHQFSLLPDTQQGNQSSQG